MEIVVILIILLIFDVRRTEKLQSVSVDDVDNRTVTSLFFTDLIVLLESFSSSSS